MAISKGRSLLGLTSVAAVVIVAAMLAGCGTDGSDEPAAAPSTPAPTPTSTTGSPCWGEAPDTAPPSSSPETEDYVGLTLGEAKEKAKGQDQQIRVAGRDGECFALTMDYRPDRVNVYLESDVVVAATLG